MFNILAAHHKGEFKLGNRQYGYPLTISEYRSRYLLACEAMASTKSDFAFAAFERVFKAFGLPAAIRNGERWCAIGSSTNKRTARRLQAPTPCLACPSFPSGGCASVVRSSASSPETRSRTAAMSACTHQPPDEPEYPFHDRTVRVTRCGRICIGKRKINLSPVFAGQILGIREVNSQIWLVSLLNQDLGFFDAKEARVEPAQNPFTPEQV